MKCQIIDAFTSEIFKGNPAAVCLLKTPVSDELMQKIAAENNLSETAFAVMDKNGYHLRWFTPNAEIDLCGHATLAAAFAIFNSDEFAPASSDNSHDRIDFFTASGTLTVVKKGELLEMDFPAYKLEKLPLIELFSKAVGKTILEAYRGRDTVLVLPSKEDVITCRPNMELIGEIDGLLTHITSRGDEKFDCYSRSFAPKFKVDEDPVCGSGHCHIIPIWSNKLSKDDILAFQASERTGVLHCKKIDDRIKMAGNAVLYSESDLKVD